jgi:hypothetical protein
LGDEIMDDLEDDYKLLYERVLRMRVDELMQEPYDPPDDEEDL